MGLSVDLALAVVSRCVSRKTPRPGGGEVEKQVGTQTPSRGPNASPKERELGGGGHSPDRSHSSTGGETRTPKPFLYPPLRARPPKTTTHVHTHTHRSGSSFSNRKAVNASKALTLRFLGARPPPAVMKRSGHPCRWWCPQVTAPTSRPRATV